MPRDRREYQAQYHKRRWERIKADPVLLELARAQHAANMARHRERIKADPVLLELARAKNAKEQAVCYAKTMIDPLKKELKNARFAAWKAKRRAAKRAMVHEEKN